MKSLTIIPSKSDAHRALIAAFLSQSPCEVLLSATSLDIEATKNCLRALEKGETLLPCGESGSTFRFLLPLVAALSKSAAFELQGRLPQRPLSPLYEQLAAHGVFLSPQGANPFYVKGQLIPGTFTLAGNVSSQYITGLLMALPLLKKSSAIHIIGPLESKGYVDLTLDVLKTFQIEVDIIPEGFFIPANQSYKGPRTYQVEGDWSNAAFWLAAGALMPNGLTVKGLNPASSQGDKAILPLLEAFGAKVHQKPEGIFIQKGELPQARRIQPLVIDASAIPDLVPPLALMAALTKGQTIIQNAGRLRLKESDRLVSITQVLQGLGADIAISGDSLVISSTGEKLKGGRVSGHHDHRIVMMGAIAAEACQNPVILTGHQAVNKSYPGFFNQLKELGLDTNLILQE